MKSNEDNKTWISNILVRNIFFMFKTSLLLLNFCLCVYMHNHVYLKNDQLAFIVNVVCFVISKSPSIYVQLYGMKCLIYMKKSQKIENVGPEMAKPHFSQLLVQRQFTLSDTKAFTRHFLTVAETLKGFEMTVHGLCRRKHVDTTNTPFASIMYVEKKSKFNLPRCKTIWAYIVTAKFTNMAALKSQFSIHLYFKSNNHSQSILYFNFGWENTKMKKMSHFYQLPW